MNFVALRSGLFTLCAVAPACTYFVEPQAGDILCLATEANPNPCPDGLACIDQICVPAPNCSDPRTGCPEGLICVEDRCVEPGDCVSAPEVCGDGIDNDCDGQIDEEPDSSKQDTCGDKVDNDCDGQIDEKHDQDNDDFTWCGDTSMPNGGPTVDCQPDDPKSYPGADETCDAIDNDCDGRTDETDGNKSLCKAGETCVGHCAKPTCANDGSIKCGPNEMCDSKGVCVPLSCENECPPGQFCDVATGMCTSTKRPNGSACASHTECLSASCIESAALRLEGTSGHVCGQTCCSDRDCAGGERCFASGSGARSCLPVALATLTNTATTTCAGDAECGMGNVCRFEDRLAISGRDIDSRNNLTTSVCEAPPTFALDVGDDCDEWTRDSCPSGECVSSSFGSGPHVCTMTCGTSEDCAPFKAALNTSARVYCRFGTPLTDSSEGDFATACVVALTSNETGSGGPGARCRNSSDCLDRGCVGASGVTDGYCYSTCCNDSQCSEVNGAKTYCRPVAFGGHYETRCMP